MALLQFTSKSIYCQIAGIHIDPWEPVDRAIITHAHSDHAREGCKHYLAHRDSETILRLRLGENISLQTVQYGERININGVIFSLHPAGHVIGSSQIRVEHNGEVWVVSGDYKLQDDKFSQPFEPVRCHSFVTESTFGLPIYRWPDQQNVYDEIQRWWAQTTADGKNCVLMGYALGKMQRLMRNLNLDGNVFAHGAVYNVNERLRGAGFDLPFVPFAGTAEKSDLKGALILAPPSAAGTSWLKRFEPFSTGYCSGWMSIRGAKNRRAIDRGFVLSDHVDWNDLNATVAATQAEQIYVTHGYTDVFARWLNDQGVSAAEVKTMYGDEMEEKNPELQS